MTGSEAGSHAPPACSTADLQRSIERHTKYSLAKAWQALSPHEMFVPVALACRDLMVERLLETEKRCRAANCKRVYYLSIEFMPGQFLGNNLLNLGIREQCREALRNLGADLDEIEASEPDPALGNGGLGRLAACILDSMATLGIAGYGYGINYEYGLFKQEIDQGYQRETPENWLRQGTPWQIARLEEACVVPIRGRIEHSVDRRGGYNPMWLDWKAVVGVPHDIPIVGFGGGTVNFLRLYSARASREFDVRIFNAGDYVKAVEQKIASETISKVLYPPGAPGSGQELRLAQEYFLSACALRDILARFEEQHNDYRQLGQYTAIQLNDTHPALAVAELMRILVDEKDLEWGTAWEVTQSTIAYTNHTLLPEALEKWPVPMLETMIPRHLQIIFEINRRFLDGVGSRWPGDRERLARMSLIEESEPKQVRMTQLAMLGSHSINGVSLLHTQAVEASLAPDFFELWPERFSDITNGITQRRWLLRANPGLAGLITTAIGDGWISDLPRLAELERYAEDPGFQDAFRAVKKANKKKLAAMIGDLHIQVDPDSMFDVHVKRIHAYKRQLLNVLRIIGEYLALVEERREPTVPRTYIFGGKAAPGYWFAQQVIKLIHNVARVINADRRAHNWMKIAFLPDYRVSLAEKIVPAADLSEQISTAGTEASGTGNMKMAMNGGIIIGTLDGATIEIREAVGAENMFVFGLGAAEVRSATERRTYRPWLYYESDARLKRALDALSSNRFCPDEPGLFDWIRTSVLDPNDRHFHLADFGPYLEAQRRAGEAFRDADFWSHMAILNVARIGPFSSDRTVREYARNIWGVAVEKGPMPGEPISPRELLLS